MEDTPSGDLFIDEIATITDTTPTFEGLTFLPTTEKYIADELAGYSRRIDTYINQEEFTNVFDCLDDHVMPILVAFPKAREFIPDIAIIYQWINDAQIPSYGYGVSGELLLMKAFLCGGLQDLPKSPQLLTQLQDDLQTIRRNPNQVDLTFETRLKGALLFPQQRELFQFSQEELDEITKNLTIANPDNFYYGNHHKQAIVMLQLLHPGLVSTMPWYKNACHVFTGDLQYKEELIKNGEQFGLSDFMHDAYYLTLLRCDGLQLTDNGLQLVHNSSPISSSIPPQPEDFV